MHYTRRQSALWECVYLYFVLKAMIHRAADIWGMPVLITAWPCTAMPHKFLLQEGRMHHTRVSADIYTDRVYVASTEHTSVTHNRSL